MHKFTGVTLAALFFALPVAAQQGGTGLPFVLTENASKTLLAADLEKAEASQTIGTLSQDKTSLTYTTQTVRLVARTGPEDDMLSFRIQGVRNPTLVVPKGAVLHVLFVNTDQDMPHDIRFGAIKSPFPIAPGTQGTVGSSKLLHVDNGSYSSEDLSLNLNVGGSYTYFCSVHGHAKSGMWGTLAVGTSVPAESGNSMAPQEEPHTMAMPDMPHMAMPGMKMSEMAGGDMGQQMSMHSTVDLNDPMSRESSGTSWLPDSSPMFMKMRMKGRRMLMLHGSAFPRYTTVGGDRNVSIAGKGSRSRFDAPTMFMAMASQPAGANGQLGVRLMTSLDPFIERGYGYPLLFQSGETYRGQALHDRQHPHDLISELSATYSRRVGNRNSAYLYIGYPGEPALGPPTFMHRVSAMDNPDAPISHHWQDATHITFGVTTLGFSTGKWKLEGSAFKGQEPDENRTNFDSPRLDSFSARLSWNPTSNLALQFSNGVLKHPEPAEPAVTSRSRTTASVILNKPLGNDTNWSNSLVWGQNNDKVEGRSNAYLLETNYQRRANTFYARFERVQKSGDELALPAPDDKRVFGVGSYAIGYVRDLKRNSGLDVGLGTQITFNTNSSGLEAYYGTGSHTGFQIFLRIRPSRIKMDQMAQQETKIK